MIILKQKRFKTKILRNKDFTKKMTFEAIAQISTGGVSITLDDSSTTYNL